MATGKTVLLSMVARVAKIKSVISLCALLLAGGCATVPDLGQKPARIDAASLASDRAFAGRRGDWPAAEWWRGFGDPALGQLIEEALRGSPDVAAAAARLRAAEAIAQQAGAALAPTLSLEASAGGTKQSKNLGIPPQFVPKGIQDTGRVAGNFSFDIDLWGKNRAALAAATSEADAARVDADQARLALSTAIADAYAELALYFAERDVAIDALKVRGTTATLTNQRVLQGLDTRGELRQAETRVPSARADVAALDESIALVRNRLAALLGAGPDRGLSIARPANLVAPANGVPDRLALDLIGRRPDIVSARLRAEAAASRIKVARADFYPNINLGAVVGLQSLGLDNLFKGGSSFGTAGPALSLPIFDGGRLAGAYRGARADYDLSVATYDSTLVTALREVADAIASLRALDTRLAEQRASLVAAEEASKIARLRYVGGLSNQLSVLTTDDLMLAQRRAVTDLEARRLVLNIALVRALGGGFEAAPVLAGAR